MDAQELQKLKNKYDIIGNDATLNRAIETAAAVAPTDLTVLISGESGVGKDVLPKMIHQMSRRRNGKYLSINCGAIPEGTISAELFGHEKGAFTGAVGERKGYFEEADGGTLFLDEIGELPKETQAMLLRVLQNGEYIKVGSSKVEKTDVRVIAATNINLAHAVARGRFREDLYYRLNAIQISMPSLRERKDDIYLLFRKFSSDFAEKYNLCKLSLSHDAILKLRSYRWPGNVRQLKNVTEAVTTMASRPLLPGAERIELDVRDLAPYIPDEKDTLLPATADASASQSMSDDDKRAIVKAILDLKNEVDFLKGELESLKGGSVPPVLPASAMPRDAHDDAEEAEWQEPAQQETAAEEPLSLKQTADSLIFKVLEKHGGNVKAAAAELGCAERTIYRKIAKRKASR